MQLLSDDKEAEKVVRRRAFIRRKYFMEVYLAEVGFNTCDQTMLTQEERECHRTDAANVYLRASNNDDVLTEAEEKELQTLLSPRSEEHQFTEKALEDMEQASALLFRMRKHMEDLTMRAGKMQQRYEEDLSRLSEIIQDIENSAPQDSVVAKVRALEAKS